MKLYNKNGEMSTPLFHFLGVLASLDFGAVMGELTALFCFAVWGEPVPPVFQVIGWALLVVNAALVLGKVNTEHRKIRLGVIPREMICEIMEENR